MQVQGAQSFRPNQPTQDSKEAVESTPWIIQSQTKTVEKTRDAGADMRLSLCY